MKRILVLGGTNFIGRNLVERLMTSGEYDISLFNRQQTQSDLFQTLKKIKGDRETADIHKIGNKKWNFVIDLYCYYPASLKAVLDQLKGIDNYIFVSTCSVYDHLINQSVLRNESAEILDCSPEQQIDRSPSTYGNRKAECERILKNAGLAHTILRPALVFGQYDPTDRFYYWLHQVNSSKDLVVPENGERQFSTTYVFDLVEAILASLKTSAASETYNVITQPQTSIGQIIEIASRFLKKDPKWINASAEFLKEEQVQEWVDMPLWIHGDHFTYSNQKLIQNLAIPLTAFDKAIEHTIKHYQGLDWYKPTYGIEEQQRQRLLKRAIHKNRSITH